MNKGRACVIIRATYKQTKSWAKEGRGGWADGRVREGGKGARDGGRGTLKGRRGSQGKLASYL